MNANKFMNIINKDIEIINEDIQKSNKIIKNGFNTLIHNIKKYSKKHPDEFSGIISGIIIFIVIIVIFSVFMHYYCINGQQKTKTGECCSLGATMKRNACYKTTCPIGERNKFGHCCPKGLTSIPHYGSNLNCLSGTAGNYIAEPDNGHGVYCLYGKTYYGNYCYLEPCQHSIYQTPSSPRTVYNSTKCCLNGLAPNEEYCNDLNCDTKMVNYTGKCCKYGPEKGNTKICNKAIKRNGHRQWWRPKKNCKTFGVSGTCCTNGLTGENNKYCNEKCKHGGLTLKGDCCKYGANKNQTKCFESKCKDESRTISGLCCGKEGVAIISSHCNSICQYDNSNHTKKGKCCPVTQKISICSAQNNE